MEMVSYSNFWSKAKPYVIVILLQFGYAGMPVISKVALNKGISPQVLVVYRHAIATLVLAPFAILLDRKKRPKMTISIFLKIALMGLLEPTIDQNLYYTGIKYTSATFTAAMYNILPAFTFILAWIFRLEKVNIKKKHSLAKILGTMVTVGGAMIMTLVKAATLDLPWQNQLEQRQSTIGQPKQQPIKGAIMISVGCFCWAAFVILQAATLKSYPAELSLAVLICLTGTIQSAIFAVPMEWGNSSAWSIQLDSKLLAAAYSGIICSGIAYYVQGVIMKTKGPVFVTAFSPLSMVIVAIMGSFFLSEILYLGRVIGAIVIVVGLYLVLWGKTKDEPLSNSDNIDNKIKPSDTQMTSQAEKIEENNPPNPDFVTIDVATGRGESDD